MTSNHPNSPSTDSLGEKIGQLKSTSETKQVGICIGSMFVWGFFWREDMIGAPACIVGCLGTVAGLYILFLKFWGESLCIFETDL